MNQLSKSEFGTDFIFKHILVLILTKNEILTLKNIIMNNLKTTITILAMALSFGLSAQNAEDKKIIKDAKKAKKKVLKAAPNLQEFFDNSAGYVIFPNVGEGALFIGAASGNGAVFENGEVIGMADLKKVDVGFQAGGQAVTELIFFESDEDLDNFKNDRTAFSGEVTGTAISKGASEKFNYDNGVLIVAMPKAGLMADVSVGGQKFSYTDLENLE